MSPEEWLEVVRREYLQDFVAAGGGAVKFAVPLGDGADDLRYCFVAVLAGPDFLADDRRGLRGYQALYFRVWDDVRDRHRQNPFANLVRLEPTRATA